MSTMSITDRTASFNSYADSIRRFTQLTQAEEATLSILIKQGDKKALEKLVNANLRFVITEAKHFQNRGLDLMELIAEGNAGLFDAAKRFDGSKGNKFISFAVHYIDQYILSAIYKHGCMIRKSNFAIRNAKKVRNAMTEFEQKNQRLPSIFELSEMTDIPESKLIGLLNETNCVDSGDELRGEGDYYTLFERQVSEEPSADAAVLQDSLRSTVCLALDNLDRNESEVIKMTFGIGYPCEMSVSDIAVALDYSTERIRQIKKKALSKLQSNKCLYALSSLAS